MEYRLYFLDENRHIRSALPFKADTDADACVMAEERGGDKPYELWCLDRCVFKSSMKTANDN